MHTRDTMDIKDTKDSTTGGTRQSRMQVIIEIMWTVIPGILPVRVKHGPTYLKDS